MPLTVKTGRGVRIAVVDSGVHPQHSHIDATRLEPGVGVAGDGRIESHGDATLDRLGHGTAVMAAIQEKARHASCIPIRVFHESLRTTGLALVVAIDWAIGQGVDIVNLSLGSTNPDHAPAFAAVVERARSRDVIIVAPRAVDDATCYPGSLDDVLSVTVDWDCPRETFRMAMDGTGAFVASGYPRPIPGVPPRRNLYGISFATAQMSGFAACALEGRSRDIRGASRIAALRAELSLVSASN